MCVCIYLYIRVYIYVVARHICLATTTWIFQIQHCSDCKYYARCGNECLRIIAVFSKMDDCWRILAVLFDRKWHTHICILYIYIHICILRQRLEILKSQLYISAMWYTNGNLSHTHPKKFYSMNSIDCSIYWLNWSI